MNSEEEFEEIWSIFKENIIRENSSDLKEEEFLQKYYSDLNYYKKKLRKVCNSEEGRKTINSVIQSILDKKKAEEEKSLKKFIFLIILSFLVSLIALIIPKESDAFVIIMIIWIPAFFIVGAFFSGIKITCRIQFLIYWEEGELHKALGMLVLWAIAFVLDLFWPIPSKSR